MLIKKYLVTMVQLMARFVLACATHTCVVQSYLCNLSELSCDVKVRLLMQQFCQS